MRTDLEDEFRAFAATAIPRLRRIALATCRDPHRADDLVQTTLEKLYAVWPRVHGVDDPLAYARTTLVRSLVSEQRRHWWQRERSTADAGHDVVAAAQTERVEQRLDLHDALSRLPERQRMAVVLRHLEDLSVAEVARLMGCSEGTVKSTTSDGLRALRSSLETVAGPRK
ncbi:SigE family RNA polymerase sigma factor [Phycicoccus ginsengisoli]